MPVLQRKSLALAAMATLSISASPGAYAQSSVAISGLIDAGIYRAFDKTKTVGTIQRSFLAFSGTEDLGGGLAATFRLSTRFEMGTGQPEGFGYKPFFQDESTVGLKGGWGGIRMGRALDAVWANDWAYDPWYNFNRIASPAWQYWHYNYSSSRTSNNGTPEYGRLANGVFYDSPKIGGFAVHVSSAFGKSSARDNAESVDSRGISINYDEGPLSLMVAGSKNSSDDTVLFVGAKYTMGPFALMGAFDRSKYEASIDDVAKVYTLGATYTVGALTFKGGYGRLNRDSQRSNFFGLGADYFLSKRTLVYVSAGHNRPATGSTASSYGVGVAHSF